MKFVRFCESDLLKEGASGSKRDTIYTHTTPIRAPLFVNFYVKGGGR